MIRRLFPLVVVGLASSLFTVGLMSAMGQGERAASQLELNVRKLRVSDESGRPVCEIGSDDRGSVFRLLCPDVTNVVELRADRATDEIEAEARISVGGPAGTASMQSSGGLKGFPETAGAEVRARTKAFGTQMLATMESGSMAATKRSMERHIGMSVTDTSCALQSVRHWTSEPAFRALLDVQIGDDWGHFRLSGVDGVPACISAHKDGKAHSVTFDQSSPLADSVREAFKRDQCQSSVSDRRDTK